ncbi:MAG: helix-hairpin-helix domain-containing protein [Desulfohalobiaceae bacterium]|nr:helix-hairpin-helix domain-containing protein [Desulfohalobiaceae bacterium]
MDRKTFLGMIVLCVGLVFMFCTPGFAECPEGSVDINTATVQELQEVNGIGSVLAQRIADYRQEHPFTSDKDVTAVKGIGEKTFKQIADSICVD